jgi:hypothetical protein
MWATLTGATLCVLSSTVLYVNLLLFFALGGVGKLFWVNPYLNVLVMGMNLDSVLNDLGMILASGLLTTIFKKKEGPARSASQGRSFAQVYDWEVRILLLRTSFFVRRCVGKCVKRVLALRWRRRVDPASSEAINEWRKSAAQRVSQA